MSFSGTPLGQGRRLDHHTFLGKPTTRPTSPHRTAITASYAYGAPTLGTRSPPKPSSDRAPDVPESSDEPALARYARLKQLEHSRTTVVTSPHPEKWSVKDTSVNIAAAFNQAVNSDTQPMNPNNSWASGSRPNSNVPRSTSVEYEKDTQTLARRVGPAPPSRIAATHSTGALRKPPVSKSASVPEPVDTNGRGKSPFEQVIDLAKKTAFYVRQRSQDPEISTDRQANGKDSSYDYTEEDKQYEATQAGPAPSARRANNLTHKRSRISTDNKAYKPSASDVEESDEDFEDDGRTRRRRKTKKKEPLGGPLTDLPTVGKYRSRKKVKGRGSKGELGVDEDDGENEEEQEAYASYQRASESRASAPPPRTSIPPRGSVPPDLQHSSDSVDIEQGLTSIPEIEEDATEDQGRHKTPNPSPPRPFSVGALLGKLVHWSWWASSAALSTIWQLLLSLFFLFGSMLGTTISVLFMTPARWISQASGPRLALLKYLALAATIAGAWYTLQNPIVHYLPSLSSPGPYRAPEVPAANIAELSARLLRIENVLSSLSIDNERARAKQDQDLKYQAELVGRLGALETRVQKDNVRAVEAEVQARAAAAQGLEVVQKEVNGLRAQLEQAGGPHREVSTSDDEARAKLRALEDRVNGVEGGVKEALELGKTASKVAAPAAGAGAAWWNKLASGGAASVGLTIKSADGQDVTKLISHLVDTAVSSHSKDTLARPDFALHSGGARVIPSLTSATLEVQPDGISRQLLGLVTGHGYAHGRPPVTALHHELHLGHCWPFAGSEGQLGIALAAPVYISHVTVDHVAPEVAFDMRSAPREMELWGMVEGTANVARVAEWEAAQRDAADARAAAAEELGEPAEDAPPAAIVLAALGRGKRAPQYVRLAAFRYDIHAPRHVQTFPVDEVVRALGLDFGIVVLRVKSNWGRDEFTCLYRVRVHGEPYGEVPQPYSEESDS